MTVLKENSMLSTRKGISYEKRYLSFKKKPGTGVWFERDNRSGEISCLLTCLVYFSLKCLSPSRRNVEENSITRDYGNKERFCGHIMQFA